MMFWVCSLCVLVCVVSFCVVDHCLICMVFCVCDARACRELYRMWHTLCLSPCCVRMMVRMGARGCPELRATSGPPPGHLHMLSMLWCRAVGSCTCGVTYCRFISGTSPGHLRDMCGTCAGHFVVCVESLMCGSLAGQVRYMCGNPIYDGWT